MANDNDSQTKIYRGVEEDSSTIIKGGYFIAPSGPAEPTFSDSISWGTAMPSLPSIQPTPTSENNIPQSAPNSESE